MNSFWEERFCEEGKIWGENPSRTAEYAITLFKKYPVRTIPIPGSGYGRNAEAFAREGFDVTGIEISPTVVALARQNSEKIQYFEGSVDNMPFDDCQYDAIYCFNVLHLCLKDPRQIFLKRCRDQLKKGGLMSVSYT